MRGTASLPALGAALPRPTTLASHVVVPRLFCLTPALTAVLADHQMAQLNLPEPLRTLRAPQVLSETFHGDHERSMFRRGVNVGAVKTLSTARRHSYGATTAAFTDRHVETCRQQMQERTGILYCCQRQSLNQPFQTETDQ
jgi:hypothetical protein